MRPRSVAPLPRSEARPMQSIAVGRAHFDRSERDLTRWPCPDCAQELPCRDHAEERVWRHFDTCQYQTFLHARVPRVDCPTHGVRQVSVPWAEARSRFTNADGAADHQSDSTVPYVTGACRIARITWDEAWGLMSSGVVRGRARKVAQPMPYIGVDEKGLSQRSPLSHGSKWAFSSDAHVRPNSACCSFTMRRVVTPCRA
jgi:transposase IS204/IS1001/IS1096/IS1165 family protein